MAGEPSGATAAGASTGAPTAEEPAGSSESVAEPDAPKRCDGDDTSSERSGGNAFSLDFVAGDGSFFADDDNAGPRPRDRVAGPLICSSPTRAGGQMYFRKYTSLYRPRALGCAGRLDPPTARDAVVEVQEKKNVASSSTHLPIGFDGKVSSPLGSWEFPCLVSRLRGCSSLVASAPPTSSPHFNHAVRRRARKSCAASITVYAEPAMALATPRIWSRES
mmetsp:Transcript_27616/g.98470  ORF Transcript_27616/g.98470 Transcript_27616/m.98470 type:complete len:220 (+) Transcript_27616:612-1271(+)